MQNGKINRIIIFSSILFIFLITGCKNFMNGGDFLDSLNESVIYTNDVFVPVTIDADMDIVKEINPIKNTYSSSYKKGDIIAVSVTERNEYAFWYWSIEPAESIEYLNDTTAKDKNIQIKIVDNESAITIKPICVKRPTIELLPEYRSDGVAKNSSIILKFSNPIEFQESTIDDIKIDCGGTDYKEYFNTAVLSEDKTQISFSSLRNKLIPTFSGIKSIDVIVPQDFSYNAGTAESPFLISFYERQELTYRINNKTIEQIKVTGVDIPEKGSLTKVGEDTLNFDEQVEYHFTANKEYVVMGWTVKDSKDEDATDIPLDIINQEESEDHKSVVLTFKAAPAGIEEVFVKPNVVDKQKLTVNFSSDHATLIPSEQKIYYTGETFTIDCREESSYFFNRWRVYDKDGNEITKEDYSDIIKVDEKDLFNHSVTIEVLDKNDSITLKPELIQRPSIVSTTPLYDSEGVYKDRRITVMFDTKLDENCIYYSSDEIKAIKQSLGDAFKALHVTDENSQIYGYQKEGDDNSIVYKAFEITMLNNQTVNLLKYYGIPTFDDGNTGVLKIGPRDATSNPPITPPGSTDILVKVKKDIGIYVNRNGKNDLVSLPSEYKWAYYTNQESDSDAPSFVNNSVKIYALKGVRNTLQEITGDDKELDKNANFTTKDDFKIYNAQGSAIWLQAKISDSGSGPESITVNFYRETSSTFADIYPVGKGIENNKPVLSKKLKLSVQQQNGSVFYRKSDGTPVEEGCLISLYDDENPELSLLENGIYYIKLMAEDKNGIPCTHDKVYYFVWDNTKPEILNIEEIRSSATSTKIDWTLPTAVDFKEITIDGKEVRSTDSEGNITPLNNTLFNTQTYTYEYYKSKSKKLGSTISNTYDGLVDQHQYEYTIRAYDWAGNYSEVIVKDDKAPAKPAILTYKRNEVSKVEVSCQKSTDMDYSKTIVERYDVDGTTCLERCEGLADPKQLITFIGNTEHPFADKTKYTFKIHNFDYSGNESEELVYTHELKPIFMFSKTCTKDSVTYSDNEFEYLDGAVRIFFDDETILEGFHASIDYKRTYNDIAPQPRNIEKDIILGDVFFDKNKKKYVDIPLYRNGHQYTFSIKVTNFDGIESDPVEIKTNTYIIEDIAQTKSKTAEEIGQFVLFGIQETYSGMSDVLTKETNFRTYGNDEVSFNKLLDDLATDICNDKDPTTKNAIIAAQKNKANGTGTTEKETILKNFEEQVERINASKATHGNETEYFKNYIKHPGSFTNLRTNGSNGTITLKPYQMAKYETVERLEYQVEYDYKHSYNVNYTNSSSVYPWGHSLYFAIQACNKASLLYGFEPCYTLYRNSNCSEIVPVYEWVYEWKYDNSDNAKKTNDYNNWDNNLICDFSKNGFRLPSDLEWECAARNGKQTGYDATYDKLTWFLPFSTTADNKESYDNKAYRAGVNKNDNNNTDNPERKPLSYRGSENKITPNYLGLWQMCGNAMEWVWDVTKDNTNYGHRSYETPYGLKSTNLNFNTDKDYISGPFANDVTNACRGGSWWDSWWEVFITSMENDGGDKYESKRTDENKWHGYRIARTIDPVADNSETR